MFKRIYKFYLRHYYSTNGSIFGLVIGFGFVKLGFFKTLFIALCVLVGYYVGKQIQKDKNFIKKLLEKILPPGSYR